MTISPGSLRFALGNRVFQIEAEKLDAQTVEIQVRLNDELVWKSEEPAWRSLGFGIIDDQLYWWSARHLVIMPKSGSDGASSLETDEDIIGAFPGASVWLLICESSARLSNPQGELSRLDFPDVVKGLRWEGERLMIEVEGHPESELAVDGDRLSWH